MKLNYNVTGEDRKQMVAIISREVGMQAVYTRMPECAYVIDSVKESRGRPQISETIDIRGRTKVDCH